MKAEEAGAGPMARWQVPYLAALVSAAVAVGAMWGPWFASGSATRNSFGFFRAAQVLGIEWVTPFRIAWFLLPVLAPLAAALAFFGARRSAAVVLLTLGLILAAVGGLSVAGFGVFWGAAVAGAASCGTMVAAAGSLIASTGRSSRRLTSRATAELSTDI